MDFKCAGDGHFGCFFGKFVQTLDESSIISNEYFLHIVGASGLLQPFFHLNFHFFAVESRKKFIFDQCSLVIAAYVSYSAGDSCTE